MTVKVTEDCRFCFAGVHKGSMEMLALDLGKLPGWPEKGASVSKRKLPYEELINICSHSDPKLRGFGAVTRVQNSSRTSIFGSSDSAKYILATGRGIKNVHIWTFSPDISDGPEWSFVYDVATNGNTIETMGFRDGGLQALSKSAGMCVRVWDLAASTPTGTSSSSSAAVAENEETSSGEATPAAAVALATTTAESADSEESSESGPVSSRLPYEDIPNSQDVRAFADHLCFGGTYEFAVVNLDAPRWANRYYDI